MDLGTRKIQGLGNGGHGSTRDKAQCILQRVQQRQQAAGLLAKAGQTVRQSVLLFGAKQQRRRLLRLGNKVMGHGATLL